MSGTVNPNGTDTSYFFQYGTTTAYGSNTPSTGAGAGSADGGSVGQPDRPHLEHDLPLPVGGSQQRRHHARLRPDVHHHDPAGGHHRPGIAGVGKPRLSLNGTVNPKGQATSYYFQYGTSTAYGLQNSPTSAGSGTGKVAVHSTITGLTTNTTYHYRLVAQNAGGTSYGADQMVT